MSIRDAARVELAAIKFGEPDTSVMLHILDTFFDQWDSGGAVYVASDVLRRLIAGKPLAPLTGHPDEWMEVGTGFDQNIRCSSVFRENGRAYDIDTPGRPTITFPYTPQEDRVPPPDFGVGDPAEPAQ